MTAQQLMHILSKAPTNTLVTFVLEDEGDRNKNEVFIISTASIDHFDNGDGLEVEVRLG